MQVRLKIFSVVFLFILSLHSNLYAQRDKNDADYLKQWEKVDSLEDKGLFRAALTEVHGIFDRASKSKHHNQVIKSVIFELKYNSYLEEDDYILGIYRLEELIATAPSPSKEILHSILAEVYWGYYSANSWKYSDRTKVANIEPKDIRTWDLKTIALKIRAHYAFSLLNAELTQSKSITDFKTILHNADHKLAMRPTLYDFLGHRALDFFKSNRFDVPGPAKQFAVDDERFFANNKTYLGFNTATNDSLNTNFLAARVLRSLTSFHYRNKNNEALFHLELERLQFAFNRSNLVNEEELYYNGLSRLTEAYKNEGYVSEAWCQIASYHSNKGQQYRFDGDTTTRYDRIKAVEICQNTIAKYPNTFGAEQCAALLSDLLDKSLGIQAEEAIYPGTISKFLLTYRNVEDLHVKIVEMDPDKLKDYKYRSEKFYKHLRKDNGVYTKEINLNTPNDYNSHSQELEIPALPHGFYYLVISTSGSFDHEDAGYALVSFWSTRITYQTRKNNRKREVLVSDRKSGKPLAGAAVKLTYQNYNSVKSEYETVLVGNFKTDEAGKFSFDRPAAYKNYNLEISYEKEVYDPDATIYEYRYYEGENKSTQTHLFTDRKIYRPGQKVYFKGIVVDYDGKKERSLKKNYSTTVYFYDVNGQEGAKKDVRTNRFGSFEGYFNAPFGVLNGQMRIQEKDGSTSFRVEDYKRPKFFVEMDPVKGEFNVNDSVKISGFAEAFAGNKIDGADVTYRVVRSTEWSRYDWWGWWPQIPSREVDLGEMKTKDDGSFSIAFKAVPDAQSDPKTLPIFNYTVYVYVTDINGETHSTSASVRVGYHGLLLGNNIPGDLDASNDFVCRVSTRNLNYETISAAGDIKINRLQSPNQPYYGRLWSRPDQQHWTKSEFEQKFPGAVYTNEDAYETWPVGKEVFKTTFNTADSDSVFFEGLKKWQPGVYRYEATAKDKNGIEVKDVKYFTVFNPSSQTVASNDVLKVRLLKSSAEPGEKVSVLVSSAEENVEILCETEANNELIETKRISLSKEQKLLEYEIKESYRGNLTLHFSAVRNNRHFNVTKTVYVPYTNKQLDLSFSTFRDKLKPGQKEEWTMTIKNKNGGEEEAELLATLYDASLDELTYPNSFYMNLYQSYYGQMAWDKPVDFSYHSGYNINYHWNDNIGYPSRYMPVLNYFGWRSYYYYYDYGIYSRGGFDDGEVLMDAVMEESDEEEPMTFAVAEKSAPMGAAMNKGSISRVAGNFDKDDRKEIASGEREQNNQDKSKDGGDLNEVKARTNFNETAFFYPQLTSNDKGEVKISFTIPESLTKWRFLGLAHTEDLKTGTISDEVVTQKELMVVPNTPRFLREGDQIKLSAKISNISEEDVEGMAQLILYDPFTEKPIGRAFNLSNQPMPFEAEKGKSTVVSWSFKVPFDISTVRYKFIAKAGKFEDGESNVLPILSNRMLVTESKPMPIRGGQTKTFNFDKLTKTGHSPTLKHHRYTLEFTSNPAWYAIQAMPYMMEYPHECAEQTFTRYYSNTIAAHIMNSNLKIKRVIEEWGNNSPDAFLSNLQKNQELKAVILEETPWVLQAKSEAETKRNLSILLDMERMSREMDKAFGKIMNMQGGNGGWPWFSGMRENRYITQHIVTGMGHLDHLGIKEVHNNRGVWKMVTKAVEFLDREIVEDFKDAKRWDPDYKENQHIGYTQIQYLYARSYFMDIPLNKTTEEAVVYYKDQAIKYWLKFNIYAEGMIALAAHRFDMKELAGDIVKSLKDRSIQKEEFGMYWKDYYVGYYWYEAPIETQALMIELFDEVAQDEKAVDELKIWLLKEKQTTHWKTTKQTTEAVYALLLQGSDLLASDELVNITLGGKPIKYTSRPDANNPFEVKPEDGTGYFKTAWEGKDVTGDLGDIKVTKKSKGVAWGAAYWQYFEDLDKITFAETNLKLKKDLYRLEVTSEGEQLVAINDQDQLNIGDKVRVRIELRTDRNLEYVHLKDMRASGLEPLSVLSRYRYQDGLGYYQSTKDAATHFFFDYIRKGTYVFEYDLRVQHKGNFSNGIATIQCMYAPEFTSHSDGIRVIVE
ncbi:MAG: alpha-2-macroglobulin family protein [Crocinitomicaceae bacterium]